MEHDVVLRHIGTTAFRNSQHRAFVKARDHIARQHSSQPAYWWALCSILSSHHLKNGRMTGTVVLWGELFPFLLIPNEDRAGAVLTEYLLYLDAPKQANLEWLSNQVNVALDHADDWSSAVSQVIERPASILESPWMALLSFQTLLTVRRAVALYGSRFAQEHRDTYWHYVFTDDCEPVGR